MNNRVIELTNEEYNAINKIKNESGNILDIGGYINDFAKKYKEKKKKKKEEEEHKKSEIKQSERNKKLLDEFNSLSSAEKNKLKKIQDQKENEFEKLAKIELRKLMSNPEFKAKIRKKIDEAFEKGVLDPDDSDYKPFYKTNKLPRTTVDNQGDYWIIIDEDQELNIVCNDIVYELARILSKKTGYYVGTGDGDEGCIYPNLPDLYTIWVDEYRKQFSTNESSYIELTNEEYSAILEYRDNEKKYRSI